jgi:predicted nucleic acid-binding protein
MIGADTSFVVDLLRGEPSAKRYAEAHPNICLCEEVVYEFLKGNLTAPQQATLMEFIAAIESFPFDRRAAIKAAELYREARRVGSIPGSVDIAIAASYLSRNVTTIVSRNNKHFANIKGLRLETY